ncbi:MAG: DNA-binding protein [Desulfurococcaceae archaeon]|jgi:predicted transcriptional regulator
MTVIVIPIKPVFAYKIFTRKKKFELRKLPHKTSPVKTGDRVVLYVSGSIKAFMGEYVVGEVLMGTPEYIIRILSMRPDSGVGEQDFAYIRGAKYAFAMEILNPLIYKTPIDMKEVLRIIPDYYPPQGIQKLDDYDPVVILLFNKARKETLRA